ncbi:MAG: uridine kinase [Bacteroidetes bacterium]|nr:uridine kinase [Bacteroidota bacterium]
MLGDVLLIQEKHKVAGEEIIQRILGQKKEKFIVAISGESGSGKSELAHVIAKGMRRHGIFAKPVHTDNYYNTDPLKRKAWRVEQGIESVVGYNEYLWDEIQKNIDDFRNNRLSEMPCVDLVTEQVDRLITDFSTVDMLIVDGLYAIKANYIDLRIFIDLTYLETKEKHTKDARGKEVMDEVRWEILGQEHKMVQFLKPLADLIITKDYQVIKAK